MQTFCCPFYLLHSVPTPNPHNSLISVIVFHCLIISHSFPHTSSLIKSREWHIAGQPQELTIYLALYTENSPQAQWSQISIAFTSPHSLPCSSEYDPFYVCVQICVREEICLCEWALLVEVIIISRAAPSFECRHWASLKVFLWRSIHPTFL